MIRVVLDTNVVVSAVVSPSGPNAQVLDLITDGKAKAYVTKALLEEYRSVFEYERLQHLNRRRIALLLVLLKKVAVMVKPGGRLRLSPDDDDNRVYECAVAAKADYIVTENRKDFPVSYKTTKIVSARRLIALLERLGR